MARSKNAVILIQGIGEQLPMDTLRSFVRTVVQPAVEGAAEEALFNKADRLSDGTDLRRLSYKGNRNRPTTDFFEYYWTPEFAPGRVLGIFRFAWKHLRTPFFRYEKGNTRHMVAWIQTVLLVAVMLAAGIIFFRHAIAQFMGQVPWLPWTLVGILAVLGIGVLILFWHFSRGALSDVLRYFSPTPRDTRARDAVRRRGVDLLVKLHADQHYERIIVVGHSLGSVIAYDILRFAWDRLRHVPASVSIADGRAASTNFQETLQLFDAEAEKLLAAGRFDEFRRLQMRLNAENAKLGIAWKVTDFVTLGSPLSHGTTLFANKRYSLVEKIAEREFPTCPPRGEQGRSFYRFDDNENPGERYWIPDGSAVFGPTQWTNIYFPTTRFLSGDPVGGPVGPQFGPGVRDVPVRLSYTGRHAWLRRVVPFWSHTQYWSRQNGTFDGLAKSRIDADRATGTKEAVPALKSALRL